MARCNQRCHFDHFARPPTQIEQTSLQAHGVTRTRRCRRWRPARSLGWSWCHHRRQSIRGTDNRVSRRTNTSLERATARSTLGVYILVARQQCLLRMRRRSGLAALPDSERTWLDLINLRDGCPQRAGAHMRCLSAPFSLHLSVLLVATLHTQPPQRIDRARLRVF